MGFIALGPIAAEMGGWSLQKVLPWAIAGAAVLILGGAAWIQTARLGATQSELRATARYLKEAREDAGRWELASDQRDNAIAMLNGEVDRLRSDSALAEQVAVNVAAANRKVLDALRKAQATLQENARANPDQVQPIGAVAAAFADGLQP